MTRSYVLALDGGTGSIRAVLFNENGIQIDSIQYEWLHVSDEQYPGSMDFDVTANWDLIKKCTRYIVNHSGINPRDIKAVSATSMREGFVLYDNNGQEIWACANVDARAGKEVMDLKKLNPQLEHLAYELSGQTFSLGAIPRLLWLKSHRPAIYDQIRYITMINDWILYKLSGLLQVDPSNACTTGIFDLKTRNWNTALAGLCGIRQDIFPTIQESGTVVGRVCHEASAETGLSEATLVITGGGDTQMAAVGVGCIYSGQVLVSGGTFWQQEVNMSSPILDKNQRVRVNCHAVKDLWQLETIVFFPGLVTRWFRDAFCSLETEMSRELNKDVYEIIEEHAKNIPVGSYGLLPVFSDVMDYGNWKHASPSFINLSLDPAKTNKWSMFRAIEENTALVTLGNLRLIQTITGNYPNEVIFAGGASKGTLWSQILADVLGVTVHIPMVKEAAALGTAIVAAVGAGIFPDVKTATEKVVRWEKSYHPTLENTQKYEQIYENWSSIYKKQLDLADSGLTTHMWKAPGL